MTIEQGFFETRDRVNLFYRFRAGSPERPLLLLLHGHGEHSGRYGKFFSRLEDLGLSMGIFDLRGNGQSGGESVYVSEFEDYLDDVSDFLRFVKKRHPGEGPLYLFGHSLGGLIATGWASEKPGQVSKLILSSPLFGIPKARLLKPVAQILNHWVPHFVIKNPVRPPFLTHDPDEVERYRKDSLIRRSITGRLAHEMLRYTSLFQEKEVSFPFPVYILMAGEDRVADRAATERFFSRLQCREKELETFPGFYHEIFNERGQDEVFGRFRDYLTR